MTLGLVGVAAELEQISSAFETLIGESDRELSERWLTDRRLIAMFSRGLERRAEQ